VPSAGILRAVKLPWIAAGLLAAFALPLAFGQPYWQENDDAFMAMVAHGYGVNAAPSIALLFSSVLYGTLIQSVGASIAGAQTYGVFSYVLLAAAAGAAAYALRRAGVGGALGAAALLIVFAPVVLYPQFTVVAGFLVVSGALVLATDGRWPAAAAAAGLFALGALVRVGEAGLTLLFILPFLVPMLRSAPRILALAVLAAAAIGGVIADRLYYAAPEWEQYVAMNEARVRFTDWGLRQYFFREPLDAMRLAWAPNDLVMIEGWFFADPRVYTPARLNELKNQVELPWLLLSNAKRYDEMMVPFRHEQFLGLLALALFATWRARSRVALWTLAALGAFMLAIALAGRPGAMRIYIPPLAAIALFALIREPRPLARLHAVLLGIGMAVAGTMLGLRNAADRAEEEVLRARICRVPAERLYVVWGDALPYERIYRPLAAPGDGCALAFYPLGVQSYAPYALARLRAGTGAGDVIQALLEGKEIDMFANGWQIDVLRRHLRIHYRRTLAWRLIDGDGQRATWFRLRIPS
jgi:hypothetical protein